MINPMLFPAMSKSQQLRYLLSQPGTVVTPDMIIEKVCFHLKVSREDITGLTRLRPIANARQQAMYLINLHCKITLKRIGAYFNRDHSTVIYAIEVVEALSETDKKYRAQLKELQSLI